MSAKLIAALKAVDWNGNAVAFCNVPTVPDSVEACNTRIAHWAHHIEQIFKGEPALCFVRDMQVSGHHVACLLGLALYKPAAAAMRGVLESALYFTYFRSHRAELETLTRDGDYYIDKKEIIDFHKLHTVGFNQNQQVIGLVSRLNSWYSKTSAIVHGQLPGVWVQAHSVSQIKHDSSTLALAMSHFREGEDIVNRLMICCVAREIWSFLSPQSKRIILKGLPSNVKVELSLDSA